MPELIRTETLHPMVVHFPIALLIVAFLFRFVAMLPGKNCMISQPFWLPASRVLLAIGTAGAWVAVYTGDLADGIVSRVICDPTVLHSHELYAFLTSVLFSCALFLELVLFVVHKSSSSTQKSSDVRSPDRSLRTCLHSKMFFGILHGLVLALMLSGSASLFYTGHLGASLVYQQGAAVYKPSPECLEFEE